MKRLLYGLVALGLLVGGAGVAKADLLVASSDTGQVLRYDENTGAFLGVFATTPDPASMAIGLDNNLYIGLGNGRDIIQRFNGQTGAFIDTFIKAVSPSGLAFGPDGNLYVENFFPVTGGPSVRRYNPVTGAFIDNFVAPGSGGLQTPEGMAFGRDGNLYLADRYDNEVLRYNGLTGAFQGVFARTLGNNGPISLVFGPDGNLYVLENPSQTGNGTLLVERFNGLTGAFMGVFGDNIVGGTDGCSLAFGPNGNLYVTTGFVGNSVVELNGLTGQFISAFRGGGLDGAAGLVFVAPIPEPATLLLLAIGTLGVIGWARWRRVSIGVCWRRSEKTKQEC
jgi:streptogramin lyase